MSRIQYNAAVKYLEKNTFRKIKANNIFTLFFLGITVYIIFLFIIKFYR